MPDPAVLPISLPPSNLRPIAYRVLSKKHGLNIQSTALSTLADYIGRQFGTEWRGPKTQLFLEQIATLWKQQDNGLFLDGDNVAAIIKELNEVASRNNSVAKPAKKNTLDSIIAQRSDTIADEYDQDSRIPIHVDEELTEEREERTQSQISMPSQNTEDDMNLTQNKYSNIEWRDHYRVLTATQHPKYKYNIDRKHFELDKSLKQDSDLPLSILNLPSIKDNITLFITRYHLIKSRLLRNELFHNSNVSTDVKDPLSGGATRHDSSTHTITSIKNLLGCHGKRFLLFGLLTKNLYGIWQVQDDTDAIELVLDQCIFPEYAYFTPGCFVLCDGIYSNNGKFYMSSIGHPPAENRSLSFDSFGNIDFLKMYSINPVNDESKRSNIPTSLSRVDKLLELKLMSLEKLLNDHRFIILGGNCYLNSLRTLEAIKKLFTNLNKELTESIEKKIAPITIVFNGSFVENAFDLSSNSSNTNSSSIYYKSYFDSLAAIISEFPTIGKTTNLIFIPGDNDPWSSIITKSSNAMWPQPAIPPVFVNRLNRVVNKVTWCSNPSRLIYLSHEIVLVRDDLGARLRRQDISYLSKIDDNTNKENELQEDVEDNDTRTELEIDKLTLSSSQSNNASLPQSQQQSTRISPEVREARKLVKTILDQGHLSPFSSGIRPVIWNQDHVLSLNVLPTMMVLTDTTTSQFDVTYEGCHVLNPGSFITKNKISYFEYYPSTRKAQVKEIYI